MKYGKAAAREFGEFCIQADDVPALIWGMGPDGCNFVNRAYLEFLGVDSPVDLRYFNWAQYVHPEDREMYLSSYLGCFQRRVPFSEVFRFRRYDGEYRWMKSEGRPRYTRGGDFSGFVWSTQDITDVKVMEDELRKAWDRLEKTVDQRMAELRESEDSYRALVEMSPDAIIVCKAGRFLYANRAALRLHGVGTIEQLQIRSVLDTIHPDDRESIAARMEQMAKGAVVPLKEARLIRPDGHVVYFESTGMQINYREETAFQVIIRDITKRKRAEEALRESEERYRSLFESSRDAIGITDMAGNILKANTAFQQMLGYSAEEMRQLNYRDLTPWRWRERDEQIVREQLIPRGFSDEYEKEYIRKDGTIFPISIRVWLIKDKNGVNQGLWAIIRDTTERRRAEESLRKSSELLDAITNSTPDHIYVKDREGRFIFVNPAVLDFFGKPGELMIGKTNQEVMGDAATLAVVLENDSRVMESGQTVVFEEVVRTPKCTLTFLSTKAPIRNDKGEVVGLVGISRNISKRKRVELELAAAKASAELYLDLMGHDINNMNQSAMGFLELALQTMEADGCINLGSKLLLEKPLQAIISSSTLIENVQKLQRLTTEGIKTAPVDLHDLFEELRAQDFHASHREITIDIEEIPHYIVEASDLLKDVFYNLINNAIKHSHPDKPVSVNLKVERSDRDGRAYYMCSVEDNGPGVPDELKPRLFYRFQRGATKAHGKGLGLYLVRTLVEGYHGCVWVEDRVQGDHTKGARFGVMLPAVDTNQYSANASNAKPGPQI